MSQQSVFDTDRLVHSYFKLALPVVFSMVITLIYNLADTYFIAKTNNAMLVAGVSLCAPLFTALMAIGNIYGQGGSALISRLLRVSRKEPHAADKQILALSPALEYIHQHYMNTFPIEDLAALCHLSPTHFRRLFHEQIGTTPLDFLHQVRVAASCALLSTSDGSIASIASQVGYASLSCYNRHFLQNMGATPSDWRKASQGEARPSVLTYTGWRKPETSEEILRKNL